MTDKKKLHQMDFKQIQELIKMINKSNIGELVIEEKGFKLSIKQKEEPVPHVYAAPVAATPVAIPAATPVAQQAVAPAADKSRAAEQAADNLITIKSPMIGTFYRSSSPGKPAFVEVGDEVNSGKVVCIIEAMKLFNEIESRSEERRVGNESKDRRRLASSV